MTFKLTWNQVRAWLLNLDFNKNNMEQLRNRGTRDSIFEMEMLSLLHGSAVGRTAFLKKEDAGSKS